MQAVTIVTLVIAVVMSAIVLYLSPVSGLVMYMASALLYPNYLAVRVGTIDLWLCRVVGAVLLCRCLASPQIRRNFKWTKMDVWAVAFIGVFFIVRLLFALQPLVQMFEHLSGLVIMDLLLPYLLFRYCIRGKSEIVTFIKRACVWILLPLAVLGTIEAFTGWQPFIELKKYTPWENPGYLRMPGRFGLERAVGPMGHPIMFGTCLAIFLPLAYALRYDRSWRRWAYFLSLVAIVGGLTSLSSGPFMTLAIIVGCLVLERHKQWVKPIIVLLLLGCVVIGVISNRPFYHVIISYLNPFGGTGWHRAMLIDLAIRDISKWWLCGYLGADPGWGPLLGNDWTDITNEYIIIGVQAGLPAVIIFSAMLGVALYTLCRAYAASADPVLRSLSWALGTIVVALMISFLGCTLFDQTKSFFYGLLGLVGSLSAITSKCQLSVSKNIVPGRPIQQLSAVHFYD